MKSKISGLGTVHAADFTSLLDVVMILLFIIMIKQADSYKQTEQQVREQSEALIAEMKEQTEAQLEEMREQADGYRSDAADARTECENLRSAAEGRDALNEYVSLINVTVYSAYNERKILISGGRFGEDYKEIVITKGTEERALRNFRDEAEKALPENDGGIVMIVFSYNSRSAYRQDIINISSVIGEIQRGHDNIYYREKNTSEE